MSAATAVDVKSNNNARVLIGVNPNEKTPVFEFTRSFQVLDGNVLADCWSGGLIKMFPKEMDPSVRVPIYAARINQIGAGIVCLHEVEASRMPVLRTLLPDYILSPLAAVENTSGKDSKGNKELNGSIIAVHKGLSIPNPAFKLSEVDDNGMVEVDVPHPGLPLPSDRIRVTSYHMECHGQAWGDTPCPEFYQKRHASFFTFMKAVTKDAPKYHIIASDLNLHHHEAVQFFAQLKKETGLSYVKSLAAAAATYDTVDNSSPWVGVMRRKYVLANDALFDLLSQHVVSNALVPQPRHEQTPDAYRENFAAQLKQVGTDHTEVTAFFEFKAAAQLPVGMAVEFCQLYPNGVKDSTGAPYVAWKSNEIPTLVQKDREAIEFNARFAPAAGVKS